MNETFEDLGILDMKWGAEQHQICHAEEAEDFLAHHGILGMKWGIRRYQNSDGTLTAAGKKRYGSDGDSSSLSPEELAARSARRKDIAKKVAIGIGVAAAVAGAAYVGYYAGTKANGLNGANSDLAKDLVNGLKNEPTVPLLPPPSETAPSGNAASDAGGQAAKPQKETKSDNGAENKTESKPHDDYNKAHDRKPVEEYSTKELAEITARLGLEKKYKDLTSSETTSGRKKVANILRGVSGVISATTPIVSIASGNNPQSGAAKAANAIGAVGKIAGAAATALDILEKMGG